MAKHKANPKHRKSSTSVTYNYAKGDGRMAKLTPKIKAAVKKGDSIAAIAKKHKISYSYAWVMARNYKYSG